MLLHLLAVGDVVAQGGLDCLHRHLRRLKKEHDVHFTVVNGENAAGLGLLPQHAEELFDAGADVITLGNHTWGKRQIADEILAGEGAQADLLFVDFHAEATSEKGAMAWYLDGRVQAVWGTHTHVPTADAQILPQGTGFITDLGMTGPARSILGVKPENSVARFLGQLPRRYEAADGPNRLGAVLFTIDTQTKRCCQVTRTDLTD